MLVIPGTAENTTYAPTRPEILIGPSRDNFEHPRYCGAWQCDPWQHPLYAQLRETAARLALPPIRRLKEMYGQFSAADIARHPALILMPYQVCSFAGNN